MELGIPVVIPRCILAGLVLARSTHTKNHSHPHLMTSREEFGKKFIRYVRWNTVFLAGYAKTTFPFERKSPPRRTRRLKIKLSMRAFIRRLRACTEYSFWKTIILLVDETGTDSTCCREASFSINAARSSEENWTLGKIALG